MTLKIISSECVLFDGEVTVVHLPGTLGGFTILKNHASIISTLGKGVLSYTAEDGTESRMEIQGGIADVDNNVIQVCIYG